jgi:Ca2+-transporting ATPase
MDPEAPQRATGRPSPDPEAGTVSGSPPRGLTTMQAEALIDQVGPNLLPNPARTRWWQRVLGQLHSPIIYILLFALSFDAMVWLREGAHGWPIESVAILLILSFNTVMGVWQEYRAEDALARLEAMAAPEVWVRRDGALSRVDAALIVPGDLIRIESGDRVPADGTVVESRGLLVDESMLTGESVPIERDVDGEVFSGTLAVRGMAWTVVTRTGGLSAMGRIASMLADVRIEGTPLERQLTTFGHRIARWIAAFAVVLVVAGVGIEGIDRFDEVLLFAVAVAVAAVPEGLPAVLTLTLALGTERMAKRKAVVRRLAAVESLGSVTVIATDKTGTLTENSMSVRKLDVVDRDRALRAMVIASESEADGASGDPLERGLYAYAESSGLDVAELRDLHPPVSVRPFDAQWRFMRATVIENGEPVSYIKGAPEVVLSMSDLTPAERVAWEQRIESLAANGYRVLALAWSRGESESDVIWLGAAALWDPPRPEVAGAIEATRRAGIRVLMITGDHPATALAVAKSVGIAADSVITGDQLDLMDDDQRRRCIGIVDVYARVSPENKLALVEALRDAGEIVAMTGDGVNDAPALKRADVGVAMGQRGSDVSREVADLVLLDDNFATITAAVEEGRSIYANILKFLRFLFSTNVALVLLIAGGVTGAAIIGLRDDAGGLLVPLIAVQLLWINIIADGPPALALGVDRNTGMLRQRPRSPSDPLLTRPAVRFILTTGVLKATVGLGLFFGLPALAYSGAAIQTSVFLYESLAQLAFVYPARRITAHPLRNTTLNIIIVASVALQVLTITVPGLRNVLGLVPLDARALTLVVSALVITIVGAEIWSRRTAHSGDLTEHDTDVHDGGYRDLVDVG